MGSACTCMSDPTDPEKDEFKAKNGNSNNYINNHASNSNQRPIYKEDEVMKTQKAYNVQQARREESQDYKELEAFGESNFIQAVEEEDIVLNPFIKEICERIGPFNYNKYKQTQTTGNDLSQGFQKEQRQPFKLPNGAIYIGEWNPIDQTREGMGKQIWPDGSLYEGYWHLDKANGMGRLIHSDGDVYEGEWLNDKAQGFGVYTHMDGAKYIGVWQEDKQHGKGKETWPDGAMYEGDYVFGRKQGLGNFQWSDGSVYSGQFINNNIEGMGEYRWADGRSYNGEWRNNKMHGKGVFFWPDGRKYEGDYLEDKKQGFGIFFWPDGRKYIGQWANGKQHGKGTFVAVNGQKRDGEWNYGKRLRWADENNNGIDDNSQARESQRFTGGGMGYDQYGNDEED